MPGPSVIALGLKSQRFDHAADEVVFTDYLTTVEWAEDRVRRLDAQLVAIAAQAPYAEPVGWLRCLRGFDTVTALSVVAELFDIRRFATARQLMAHLGLVPSERSSGASLCQGGITKTGNAHVRRLLVEAAWHARHRPAVSQALRQRRRGQPPEIVALADRAMQRFWRRWWHLVHHGKSTPKATTAVARELAASSGRSCSSARRSRPRADEERQRSTRPGREPARTGETRWIRGPAILLCDRPPRRPDSRS